MEEPTRISASEAARALCNTRLKDAPGYAQWHTLSEIVVVVEGRGDEENTTLLLSHVEYDAEMNVIRIIADNTVVG
jgi:hypothetical protein